MVLLDSEGIDAASSVGYDDNQIFTLTVLLASVLIYNSQGVPMRRDLEGLEYPLLTLLYPYSLSLRFEQFLTLLIVCSLLLFLGGDKSTEKGGALIQGHLIVALFYFLIPLLFGKMNVYFDRWLREWQIE